MKRLLLSCALPTFLVAQIDGVIGTATRTVTLTPTEALFQIQVVTEQTKTIDDVLPKLKDFGIAAEHLVNINLQQFGPPPAPVRLAYGFRLVVPIAKIKDTVDRIAAIRRTEQEMDIQGFMTAVQPSSTAMEDQRRRLFAELFAEAKKRAEEVAQQANVQAGKVVSVSESPGQFFPGVPQPLQASYAVTVRLAIN